MQLATDLPKPAATADDAASYCELNGFVKLSWTQSNPHSFLTCPFQPALQDLCGTLSWVRRRCRDDKALARKAALQLLESLLVLQASWQGRPTVAPADQDLGLMEAAAADALVRLILLFSCILTGFCWLGSTSCTTGLVVIEAAAADALVSCLAYYVLLFCDVGLLMM